METATVEVNAREEAVAIVASLRHPASRAIEDGLLPSQLLHPAADSGARKLVRAVLETAIRDALTSARNYSDALAWITSDAVEPFSFLWVCDALGLDADTLRIRLARRREHVVIATENRLVCRRSA